MLVGGPAAVVRARELLSPLSGQPSATTDFLEEDKAAAAAKAAHTQNHTALSKVATKAAARAAAKADGIYVLPKVVDRSFVASLGRPSVVTGGTEVDKLDPRNHRRPPALSNCHGGRRQPSPEEHLIAVAISGPAHLHNRIRVAQYLHNNGTTDPAPCKRVHGTRLVEQGHGPIC